MAPVSRFTTSKFRNAQLYPAVRPELLRGQLPFSGSATSTTGSAANSTFSSEIKTNYSYIVTVSPAGDLSFRAYPSGPVVGAAKVASGGVGDWDLSRLNDGLVAVGGLDGRVHTFRLPSSEEGQLVPLGSFKLDDPVTHVLLHPNTPAILLTSCASGKTSVRNLATDDLLILQQKGSKALWDLSWSPCGRFVAGIGKDGLLSIWEPRKGADALVTKQMSLMQQLKLARVQWVRDVLFLTSFSRSRDRQYTIHSTDFSRNLETIAQQTIDQNTAVLKSAIDHERGIVYAAGRGDMTLRQIEIGGPSGFIETIHPLTSPLASSSLALAHPATLSVMQAQIGSLLLPIIDKDGDAIQPTAIKVPRRQLIDYHEELFPDFRSDEPLQTADAWWTGEDASPVLWPLDPARRQTWEKRIEERKTIKDNSPAAAAKTEVLPSEVRATAAPAGVRSSAPRTEQDVGSRATRIEAPVEIKESNSATTAKVAEPQRPAVKPVDGTSDITATHQEVPEAVSAVGPAPADSTPIGLSHDSSIMPATATLGATSASALAPTAPAGTTSAGDHKASTASRAPFNPTWSRKFLGAKAALIPSYDQLPPLSSLHPDSLLLQTSKNHLFFPIAGPGGRLAVHPRRAKGRMPVGGRGYLSGGVEMVGFCVDPFGDRVAVAGEDGAVRVWSLSSDGFEGVGPEANSVLKGKSVDRITQVAFHPTAKDLLIVATNDLGKAHLRFWDLVAQQEQSVVPLDVKGIFNFTFSPQGDKLAVATKDRRVLVLDPRNPASAYGKAHDSPRSFQLAWVNGNHLLSVGFSSGSQRKIQLYRIEGEIIQVIEAQTIDVSPSVLFPVFDADTSILYIWGRGERAIQAYQIDLADGARERIAKLPAYTGSNAQLGVWFGPKSEVDVRKVEVGKCWRLTAKTIEEVSFSIPRNKPDFFQDDIYVPTLDVETPALSAKEWLDGTIKSLRYINLRPDDLKLLSEAPKPQASNKPKFIPGAKVMSEEERKRQEMEELFKKAKMDLSDSESEEERGVPAPDDDW